ncbi:MAG: triose-phosphate isomerase [Candidatus Colwellbacteria bacterium RIFCSPLOWO2_01_FULL_48_10]|uniref:Triosephosphate isomerase n=1 Tax=Candidatus Colwellbacteria bacterium RIFCSPLOWO2_01_FULL_48_10 TaxID=1797690 RepID=A0A1G1Z3C6_9BACT|nr:MAG: triose-phosphate isomerase [Candidatus Colwellbacteria bacterium RIFCSPLOWO2_01_FULL_48_10]
MKLIVANWKSNPSTHAEAIRLAKEIDWKGVVIVPPFIYLEAISDVLKNASLGAQDVSPNDVGPHTGEIAPRQLIDLKVEYVIVGHSERRKAGETDEEIQKELVATLNAGLKAVLCVGESAEVRKNGFEAAKKFVKEQLESVFSGLSQSLKVMSYELYVAYEPIWAIGTGTTDTPESAAEMASFIKQLMVNSYKLSVNVLYGGSLNASNAKSFLSRSEIGGALVGGASLRSDEFKKIVETTQ